MPRWIQEILIIGALTLAAAYLSQLILPNRIPLRTTYETIRTDDGERHLPTVVVGNVGVDSSGQPGTLTTIEAYEHFQQGSALFIDAREVEDYHFGHIQGALNIPYHAFMDSVDRLDALPRDTVIIVYCDGQECNASLELAADLEIMGFEQVLSYFGGWQAWTQAGHPVEGSLP